MSINKVFILCIATFAILGNNSEASSSDLTLFDTLSSFGNWLEEDNGATQVVAVEFTPKGGYHIAKLANMQYGGSIFDKNDINNINRMTGSYFRSTSISESGKNVTLNDFDSYNIKYKLLLKSTRPGGTNVILNCKSDEMMFGDICTNNILSISFNNAPSTVSIKSIYNSSSTPVEINGCGSNISIRTANINCRTSSKLFANKGYNKISFS